MPEPSRGSSSIYGQAIDVDDINHVFTHHPETVVERLRLYNLTECMNRIYLRFGSNVPNVQLSHIYRRLLPNEPSYTVTGNGGGGTHMYHWDEPRALTNRERARLQSFPDHFMFHGKNNSIRSQIGMAIPPLGSHVIFEAILKTFAGIPYDNIPSNL